MRHLSKVLAIDTLKELVAYYVATETLNPAEEIAIAMVLRGAISRHQASPADRAVKPVRT